MRNTVGKNKIREIISNSRIALSQSDIQNQLNDVCDRVTTYRILNRLEEEGFVHKIINNDGVVKYAKCSSCTEHAHTHQHAHFSCIKCKEVSCIENTDLHIKLDPTYTITDMQLLISGICPKCQA
ncbi:MAG: transcriptional repressor [Cytophagales bacterium]